MSELLTPSESASSAASRDPRVGAAEAVVGRYPFGMPFGWFQIAWSAELAPGAVIPRYYFGRHLVLWRDEEGTVHLQDAHCPHLGAHLGHGGKVLGTEIQCPFHGWQFDGEGNNTCIPYSERTNAKAKIRAYPVTEVGDHFVMAWYHPDDEAPKWEIPVQDEMVSDDFSDWHTEEFSVSVACQELNENSVDGPHFRYVHNTQNVPEIQSYETEGHLAKMRSLQYFPTPRGTVEGRIDVDNHGPGFAVTRFSGIVDTFLVGAAIPVDETRSEVRFSFKVRNLGDENATSGVGRAFVQEVCKQFEEDKPIWQNKAHITRPALADTDPPFMKFRKWYSQFYAHGQVKEPTFWVPPGPSEGQPVHIPTGPTASRRNRED